MNGIKLNLARAWRSSNFDQIVGQNIAVRILKNSLFLDQYFPVYLFAGQRGCGKTSMARLFAASINCEKLSVFQKHPREVSLPCQECASCVAMKGGRHPDYIEIDAASHTGVDNVRQIIDAASLLPVAGRKKIYLIDEAHMLSKAAFNAFLKILEEPPVSVLFILATTDMYKIIDTVRSRSFQVFFKPVPPSIVAEHLERICQHEHIPYQKGGLDIIARQTEGSVRDAINLLEQVRFSTDVVDEKAVLALLGYMSDEYMLQLVEAVIDENPERVLAFLKQLPFSDYNPLVVWQQYILLLRSLVWVSYRLEPPAYIEHTQRLSEYAQRLSGKRLVHMLQIMYDHELVFFKTAQQHDMFELILLLMCQRPSQGAAPAQEVNHVVLQPARQQQMTPVQTAPIKQELREQSASENTTTPWSQVLQALAEKKIFLMQSVFNQMKFREYDSNAHVVRVALGAQHIFYKELLDAHQNDWQPLIQSAFGQQAKLDVQFDTVEMSAARVDMPEQKRENVSPAPSNTRPGADHADGQRRSEHFVGRQVNKNQEKIVDVAAGTLSKNAEMLLSVLPGTLVEVTSSEVKK